MKQIVVNGSDIEFFSAPKQYKQQLLSLIAQARQRIFITALYLQDDDAGREVLHALYQAKISATNTISIGAFVIILFMLILTSLSFLVSRSMLIDLSCQ